MNLEKYLIAEEGIGTGLGIGALVGSILGVSIGAAIKHNKKKQIEVQKANRENLNKWFESKNLGTSDVQIKSFIETQIQKIANSGLGHVNKIIRNSTFKKNFEASVKKNLDKIHAEYVNSDDEDDEDRIKWSVYRPNCATLKPEIFSKFLKSDGFIHIELIDENSKLCDGILSSESPDVGLEFLEDILSSTLNDVGNGVVTKLNEEFKELIDSGLISIKYYSFLESEYEGMPYIEIRANKISSNDGRGFLYKSK